MTRGRLGLIVLATLAAFSWGCSSNPTTGRSQMTLLSKEREIALGEGAKAELASEYGGAVADAQLQAYVARIGHALAAVTESDNPSLPWEFTLLDSDVINAFALPGGKVFMSRGLAARMTNEAQLAAVLGHEVGHVTARHSNERISHAMLVQGLVVGAAVGAAQSDEKWLQSAVPVVVGFGGQGYLLKFNRDQELEADALGVRYMVRNGYNPLGARQVQEILQAAAGEGSRPPEFFSTHPYPERRIEQINRLLRGEYAYTQDRPDQYQLHEDRFQREFKSRLASLPPAAAPARAFASLASAGFDPMDAGSWCAHCRSGAGR